jgi:hypothetical protein
VVVVVAGRLDKKEKKKKNRTFVVLGSVSGAAGAHAVGHVVGRRRGWSGMVVVAAVAIRAWGDGRWHLAGQGCEV